MTRRKVHWVHGRAVSWPSGGRRYPNRRTFMPRGDAPVCMAADPHEGTDDPEKVTCGHCVRRMRIARFDTDRVVREVLSRGSEEADRA